MIKIRGVFLIKKEMAKSVGLFQDNRDINRKQEKEKAKKIKLGE